MYLLSTQTCLSSRSEWNIHSIENTVKIGR